MLAEAEEEGVRHGLSWQQAASLLRMRRKLLAINLPFLCESAKLEGRGGPSRSLESPP
jgi:hypothetical protein